MNTISKVLAAATLTAASVSANAWYGYGPYDGVGDFFGDGHFSMNFSAGASARSRAYGYGYNAPYWGYPYYGYAPVLAPAANTEEAQKAIEAQQKLFAEQQAQAVKAAQEMAAQQAEAFRQAVEAQRKVAEQYAANQPVIRDPLFSRHNDLMQRVVEDQADAHRRFADVHQEMNQRMVEDQQRFWTDVRDMHTAPFAPVNFEERVKEAEARRAEMVKEMDARRAETMRMIEEQRTAYRRDI